MATATNSLTKAIANAKVALTKCVAFQTWVNASEAEAGASVHEYAYPIEPAARKRFTKAELQATRPLALINVELPFRREGRSSNAGNYDYGSIGRLTVQFEQDVPGDIASNNSEVAKTFLNTVVDIMEEWESLLSGVAGSLVMENWEMTECFRPATDEVPSLGDFILAICTVEWKT